MLFGFKKYIISLFLFFFYAASFADKSVPPIEPIQTNFRIKAILFDTFGTVVDWRGTMKEEFQTFFKQKTIENVNIDSFIDSWVSQYSDNMAKISQGKMPFATVDELNKNSLDKTLIQYSIFNQFSESQRNEMWHIWHHLKPWPDSVSGLNRLKKDFIIGALSNGNVRLLVDLSKNGGLNWDVIISGEQIGHYKPNPIVYQTSATLLNLKPEEILLVASHKFDLKAAKNCGFKTAYLFRPLEFNSVSKEQIPIDKEFDYLITDINELAPKVKI